MSVSYQDKDFIYAVARIRFAELRLLNRQAFDRLCEASDVENCISILSELGFGGEDKSPEAMLRDERSKLWRLIDELVPDTSVFRVFRLQNDYQNLKAAIKGSVMEQELPGIYTAEAELDTELLRAAIREKDYKRLPEPMAGIAEEAHEVFLRTRDGQLCDVMVDRAALSAILDSARASKDDTLLRYAELTVAAADIKIAVRASIAGRDETFLRRALCDCGSLDMELLIRAALSGPEAVYELLSNTDYADAVGELKTSMASFERWCDDLIIRSMRPQLYNSFGLGPIAAYILAKETEIRSVRILLTARENGFPTDMIRERMRETYV